MQSRSRLLQPRSHDTVDQGTFDQRLHRNVTTVVPKALTREFHARGRTRGVAKGGVRKNFRVDS